MTVPKSTALAPEIPEDPALTEMVEQSFTVRYDYPVYFTENVFRPENGTFAEAINRGGGGGPRRVAVFVDDGLLAARPGLMGEIDEYAAAHGIELAAVPEAVEGGEKAKNDAAIVTRLQKRLLELGMDRHSTVIAVGGGAMLDVVGYAAATTHRGVRLIRVPTTVLAQNDSGVGVKNGINAHGVKNLVGTFAPPFAVINDVAFTATLGPRDRIAGMAEAVKVALIRDGAFFAWLEQNAEALARFERGPLAFLIRRAAELHMRQIAHGGDPFESGSVRPLDYGHWAAHKLEFLTAHALNHGEAVAIGMALDARYAVQSGLLPPGEEERICRLLEALGFRLWHPAIRAADANGRPSLLAGLHEFREHLGGELTVTLLQQIGTGVEVHDMDVAGIGRAIDWLEERDRTR